MTRPRPRRILARTPVTAAMAAVTVVALAVSAGATPITPAVPRGGSLVQVGPIADNGFPTWYRDSNNVRLEACVTLDDPLCPVLADTLPNPDAPISFPDNYPDEFFYQLAGAAVPLTTGATANIGMDLEGAFATGPAIPGDQMVFGRIRIRFPAPAGEKYRITHPYGIDEIVADATRGVNMTEDIGITPGDFGGALKSRVGPFLKWDPAVAPAAPAGYTGNPGIDHQVVGSPYNTNFVRVERIDDAGTVLAVLGQTNLFSVQGRYATNSGVDVNQATYTVGADGKGAIEVYASSEPDQSIQVTGNPTLGFNTTKLRGQNGRYYGRIPVTGSVPAGTSIDVVNVGDKPVTKKTQKLVDIVKVTQASYNADARTLTVAATSSDADSTPGVLSVDGFGPITATPFANVTAPPAQITVTSSMGGKITVPLYGNTGAPFLPDPPVVAALAPTTAVVGQRVILDGTGSTGEITSYQWTQTGGPAVTLTGANTVSASFTPTVTGTYQFTLTVQGPGGTAGPSPVTITVSPVTAIVANAGPDQTVQRGLGVALDGSATKGVNTFSWTQVSGPAVTLNGAATAKPTFTYPTMALPAAPGPNPAYTANNAPLVFRMTVTGPGGTATDTVQINPAPDSFVGTTARYRTRGEWRLAGNTSLLAGQRVTAVLGSTLTGQVIGTTSVDATGAWAIKVATPNPGTIRTISLVSSTGAIQLAFPLTVTN